MPRTRTFLAIEPSEDVREQLIALQGELDTAVADVKWDEPANLHLTLLFLGEVEDRELAAVCRATQQVLMAVPAFTMRVEGIGCFPNLRRPRFLWAGIGQGLQEVVAVHDALEPPLLDLGCYRREERKYTPHITLGRRRTEGPADDALAQTLANYQGWTAGESAVDAVHVMASQLTPQGPQYRVLSRAKLA